MIRELDTQEALETVGAWGCTDTTNTIASILGGFTAGVVGVGAGVASKNPYVAAAAGGGAGGFVYGVTNGVLNSIFC